MSEYTDRFDMISSVGNAIAGIATGIGKAVYDVGEAAVTKPIPFAIATATETVFTLWNSLVPERFEASTEGFLSAVNEDASKLFSANPDSVHFASMMAGAFVPAGLGMKLLGMARSGRVALGYSPEALGASIVGSKQRMLGQEIETIFRKAGGEAAELKSLTRKMFAANVSKEVMDNFILEAAVVGMLNAHPYMEDYWDDPLKNFMLGGLIGGVVGTAFAYPSTKATVRKITAPIETARHEEILETGVKQVNVAFTNTGKYQGAQRNVELMDVLVNDTSKPQILRDQAESRRFTERANAAQAIKDAAPWVENAPTQVQLLVKRIFADPHLLGVDKITEIGLDEITHTTSKRTVISPTMLTPAGEADTVLIRLGTGEVFAPAGGPNAAMAAQIPEIDRILAAEANQTKINVVSPSLNYAENTLFRAQSTAQQNADHLKELVGIPAVPKRQLQDHAAVAPDHLSRMNAYIAYADTLTPEAKARFRVRVTGDYPTYAAQQNFLEATVGPNYWRDLDNVVLSSKVMDEYTPQSEFIAEWISSVHDQIPRAQFRRAFDAHFRGVPPPKGEEFNVEIAKKIWEDGERIRSQLAGIATAEGKIYLYRGLTKDPVGHSAIESYTNNPDVAGSVFSAPGGGPKLFEVPVENVITAFPLGASDGRKFHEFLVGPPHHKVVNNVPMQTGQSTPVILPLGHIRNSVGVDDLIKLYTNAAEKQIKDLASTGEFSVQEISIRLGVDVNAVNQVIGGMPLAEAKHNWRMYTDPKKVKQYIGPENKLYALQGNPSKNPLADAYSNLDRHAARAKHQQEVESFTRSSQSLYANSMLDVLEPNRLDLDTFAREIAEIGQTTVGDVRVQSADQAVRALKNGYIATGIGKQILNAGDANRKTILEPLAAPLAGLRENPTKLAEMSRVINKLYSLRGWRDIIEDPISGKHVLVNEDSAGGYKFVYQENGDVFFIHQPEVAHALNAMREPSRELFNTNNLNRKLRGMAPLNDIGFYMPPINLVNKNFAFVIDRTGVKGTQMLLADDAETLLSQVNAWKAANAHTPGMEVLLKGNVEADTLARSYHDGTMNITHADISAEHTGVASLGIIPTDARLLKNILENYETAFIQSGRSYVSHYLQDTVGWLDHLSYFNQRGERDTAKQGLKKPYVEDGARAIKNILLGQDQLRQSPGLTSFNNHTEFLLNSAFNKLDVTVATLRDRRLTTADWDKLEADVRAVGITEPIYKSFDLFKAAHIPEARNVAPAVVSAGSSLVATMALRFLEFANAAMNVMSLPILSWSALMERLPGTALGGAKNESVVLPLRMGMEAIRHMWSPQGKTIEAVWEKQGSISQVLRQFEDSIVNINRAGMSSNATEKAVQALHNFTNSKGMVGMLSKPSDWAETFTRKFAMHLGYVSAKRAYPGITDSGATLAAMHMADRIVGNYHAPQRPTMFQGTFGAAIGLYQTYMLTFAQHVYRGLEEKNLKQLSSLMLAQAGMFGMKSLPGYNLLSEQVVSQFSNNNWDLTTGTYRAVGDSTAELILYGLPSSITGAAFYTRGDITPRVPGNVTDLALLNSVRQGYGFVTDVISKVSQGVQDGHITRSMLEALSLQSMNRPIARISEVMLGTSQTKQGNTVSTADQVWTPFGISARILGTRPMEEQVLREAIHLNKFYEQRDFENRQRLTERVKRELRAGELNDETLSNAASEYIRMGGSSKGWRSAMNEVLINSDRGMRGDLKRKLEPTNPLHTMLGDLY